MSVAAFQPVAVAVLAVCAVVSMVFAALAERRKTGGATGLLRLGVLCAVLAGVAYAVPVALLAQ